MNEIQEIVTTRRRTDPEFSHSVRIKERIGIAKAGIVANRRRTYDAELRDIAVWKRADVKFRINRRIRPNDDDGMR